jgi:AcrR family transcriptional regulator
MVTKTKMIAQGTKVHRRTRIVAAPIKTARTKERIAGGMREEVNAYKKELILRAACETFYEHGYHDTTVDMLAEKLSGTKAIFYYYYADKHTVLEEIFKRAMANAIAVVQRAVSGGGSPAAVLNAFARSYTLWVIDNQLLVGVFWREVRSLSAGARAAVAVEQKKFDNMVAGIIKDGIASGNFAVSDEKTASRAISGMISAIYTWWRPGGRMSRDDTADYYAALALRLVSSR